MRNHKKNNQCEKYLLRKAFEGKNIIPDEILWRTKEAFSDGVSKQSRSWFEIIQEHVKNDIFDMDLKTGKTDQEIIDSWVKKCNITHNIPTTLEQTYYRMVFEIRYRGHGKTIPYFWMPNFVEATDASARTLSDYKVRMKQSDKEMNKETEKNEVKQINETTISI
jgi:asparagine synthase (glutamine-hydrolysing)